MSANSSKPAHFLNRELSWLEFNQRVLDEASNADNPLLERLKFFCIVSSNLDEFFEVRVAGLKQQIESDVVSRSIDGLSSSTSITKAASSRARSAATTSAWPGGGAYVGASSTPAPYRARRDVPSPRSA